MTHRARPSYPLACLVLLLLTRLVLPVNPALAAPALLEDLSYRLEVLVWPDAARLRLTLKRLAPGRYVVEAVGETQGFIKLISGGHRERLQTEMVWRDRRLQPLVYREESWRHGKRRLQEYRFDYPRKRLELWQGKDGGKLVKKWATTLSKPVYDPLTAFYNCRLGILGPTREGETGDIPGIPYPHPEAMEVRLGAKTPEGRKAMVSLVNPVFEDARGQVFAYVDDRLVPRRAWTTVFGITVTGTLLPDSLLLPAGIKELPGPGSVAAR